MPSERFEKYKHNLSKTKIEKNYFFTTWGNIVLRNCNRSGDFVNFKTKKQFCSDDEPLWINLSLHIFRNTSTNEIFPAWKCDSCPRMRNLDSLAMTQRKKSVKDMKCIHSKMASSLAGENWQNRWPALQLGTVRNNEEAFRVNISENIKYQILREDKILLVAVNSLDSVSLLYTVSDGQHFPLCSVCCKQKCGCYGLYKSEVEAAGGEDVGHYWDRRKGKARPPDMDPLYGEDPHFYQRYGFNRTQFLYPVTRDPVLSPIVSVHTGEFVLPQSLEPEYSEELRCQHGHLFEKNNRKGLVLIHQQITIVTMEKELETKTQIFGRRSVGKCRCVQQPDTHSFLLWNLGNSIFLAYSLLISTVHQWSKGTPIRSQAINRTEVWRVQGKISVLRVDDLTRAMIGFCHNMEHLDEDSLCDDCGKTPSYIVIDGKCVAPSTDKVKGIEELQVAEDDDQILGQASKFKDRVFLVKKMERNLLKGLVSGMVTPADFLANQELSSENVLLVKKLVQHCLSTHTEITSDYVKLLDCLSKNSAVAGLLQVTEETTLPILAEYCNERFNIKSAARGEELKLVSRELPVLWRILNSITILEKTIFLPEPVRDIILELIRIRVETFTKASVRNPADIFPWTGSEETPTQSYRNWRLKHHPKQYSVSNSTTSRSCSKAFYKCWMCLQKKHYLWIRDNAEPRISTQCFQGIIFDFACGAHAYCLNREPREFQYIRFLVDSAHYRGHKKMKRNTNQSIGGHTGCSEGYNFKNYKPSLKGLQSEGREQIHSRLERLTPSLRQCNFASFMILVKVFFTLENLRQKGLI